MVQSDLNGDILIERSVFSNSNNIFTQCTLHHGSRSMLVVAGYLHTSTGSPRASSSTQYPIGLLQELVGAIIEHIYFKMFIFGLIVINSLVIGIETSDDLVSHAIVAPFTVHSMSLY